MKILITGISGMLGVDLYQTLREEYEVIGVDRRDFPCSPSPSVHKIDITNLEAVKELFSRLTPHFVIHAAAYTDVDGCEKDADKAYKVNALGTRNIARGLLMMSLMSSLQLIFMENRSWQGKVTLSLFSRGILL